MYFITSDSIWNMWDVNTEIRFDDAAAAHAVAVVRSAIGSTERLLEDRRTRVHDLGFWWEGYAQRWFDQQHTGLEMVAASTLEHLRSLATRIESQRAHASADRAAQHAARVRWAEQQREALAEAQRREAEAAAASAAAKAKAKARALKDAPDEPGQGDAL